MSADDPRDLARLLVETINAHWSEQGVLAIDPEVARQALLLTLAALLEADPGLTTPSAIRAVADECARDLRAQIKAYRDFYEETGIRAWEAVHPSIQ